MDLHGLTIISDPTTRWKIIIHFVIAPDSLYPTESLIQLGAGVALKVILLPEKRVPFGMQQF